MADFFLAGRRVSPSLARVFSGEGTSTVTVTLEPKVLRVLLLLARRPGEVVTKEELFRDVWEGAFVTEDVLTRAIGELRRVFGDSSAAPHVIETIRKSGYRLIAAIVPVEPVVLAASEPPGPVPSTVADALPSRVPASEILPARGGGDARRRRKTFALILGGAVLIAAAGIFAGQRFGAGRAAAPMRVRPFTTFPGNQRDPAVSPDGSRVAFAWNGGAGDAMSLYIQLADGDAPLRVTRADAVEDRAPAWSPDGQRIAFTRREGRECRILVVSSLGGGEKPLAPCGDFDYRRLAWSPDGRWLARSVRPAVGPLFLELLSPDTLERRPITHPPAGILGDTSPAFSPDGLEIAFSRNVTEGVGDVFRVGVASSTGREEPVRLTFDDRDTMGLDWSPDGSSVVFSSSRAGIYSLWRVARRGGDPTFVAGGGAKMKHPSSSRGRNIIAYESWTYEVSLWRVPADREAAAGAANGSSSSNGGESTLRLTSAADEWDFGPQVSPDGLRIAFVSTRSGSDEIWTVGQGGGESNRLTSFGGGRIETPRWSPDGRHLVLSVRRGAHADLYRIASSGGVAERLTSGEADAVAPFFTRDGRAVEFGSRRSGAWRVWRLDLASRRLDSVTPDGGYAAQESVDGRVLYFSRADASGIWRIAAFGGAAANGSVPGMEGVERVVPSLAPEDWADWQVSDGGIYSRVRGAGGRSSVVFTPFSGSTRSTFSARTTADVAPLLDQGWSGFSVSPDGRWLVYPRIQKHSCELRLIENPA